MEDFLLLLHHASKLDLNDMSYPHKLADHNQLKFSNRFDIVLKSSADGLQEKSKLYTYEMKLDLMREIGVGDDLVVLTL